MKIYVPYSKFLLLIIILLTLTKNLNAEEETRLEQVQIVFRHGARTPIGTYPSDPYQEAHWKEYGGFGQLTQTGMLQHSSYGQYLRNRYSSFLNDTYSRDNVLVMSTDYDRTLMSAYSLLSSLYKPVGFQIWNKNLSWQPIPVHIGDPKIFLSTDNCPRHIELINELTASEEFKVYKEEYQDLLDLVIKYSGFKEMDLLSLWKISDVVIIEKSHNLTLPKWVEDNYDKFVRIQDLGFYLEFYYTELAKLTSGGILNQVRKNLLNESKGITNKDLILFSSHDSYVAALIKLLNLTTHINQPPFTSSVIFELRKSVVNSNYFIQVLLKNNSDSQQIDLIKLKIYGCENLCPLEDFIKITEKMVVQDSAQACAKQMILIGISSVTFIISIVLCASVAVVFAVASVLTYRFSIKRSSFRDDQLSQYERINLFAEEDFEDLGQKLDEDKTEFIHLQR